MGYHSLQDTRNTTALDEVANNVWQALVQGKVQACEDLWLRGQFPNGFWVGGWRAGRRGCESGLGWRLGVTLAGTGAAAAQGW
jgi:hypothetical protein